LTATNEYNGPFLRVSIKSQIQLRMWLTSHKPKIFKQEAQLSQTDIVMLM